MTCYHPLKGFKYGVTKNGKPNYIITGSDVKHIEITGDRLVKVYHDGVISPFCDSAVTDFIQIPCGKCIGCRLDYSRNWANRCILEASQYDLNCFITLTYDDVHLPFSENAAGVKSPCLVKRHFQLFMKRLRKRFGNNIRFFACGEYGEKFLRPHFHAILFNHDFQDKKLFYTKDGLSYYLSDDLQKLWTNGYSVIGDVSWDSCCYVARYVTKKLNGDVAPYEDLNISPPFMLCSNRPGIGKAGLEDIKEDLLSYGAKYISTPSGSVCLTSNNYFDRILSNSNPVEFEELKQLRIDVAKDKQLMKKRSSSLPFSSQLEAEERQLVAKTKVLARKDI